MCASCPKAWEGAALGMQRCTGKECGSPVARRDFPEYCGSLTDLSALCFVCGNKDVVAHARVEDGTKMLGICMAHLEVVDNNMVPKSSGINVPNKKVFICPMADKVMPEYRGAQHVL